MANIKNFGIAGVSSDVQFGKGGAKLIEASGLFQARNADNANYVRMQAAAPVGSDDLTTKLYVDDEVALLQGELDATQLGAGLETDGSFTVANTNYIDAATSLKNAAELLDTALKTEEDARIAADAAETTAREAAISALQANAVLRDGSQAFTGNQSMGGNLLTNIGTPVDNADAATKGYVDASIAVLGNAFNYVGVLSGGVDSGSAFDLATLPAGQTDSGDYFKVANAGYFTFGSTTLFANVNDGIVINTDGGIDIIDNTNSTVAGTVDFVDVSGSADTGFTVDLSATFKDRMTQAETDIDAEEAARIAADNTLQSNIDAEAGLRANADTLLQSNIDAEETARIAADDALQAELDATQLGSGLDANGGYIVLGSSTYLGNATSLASATEALDVAVAQVANDLANLSQDEIVSLDTFTSVRAANTGVEISVDVGGSKTKVMDVVGGVDTNTDLTVNFGTADEIRLEAAGSVPDVDIRLVPQGAGQVFIGETGDGTIQADDGFNLILAGGDNASGDGGDVVIRAGDGSGADGIVDIQNANEASIARFVGTAADTGYATVTSGTTTVTFGAEGTETDISLVLAPKGAGTVDASSARVVNVAAPVDANDAANKAYVDSQIAGGVDTLIVDITETTGTVSLGTITGTVLRVKVVVTTAYSSGATITVGSAADTDLIATSAEIDESATGIYLIEAAEQVSATEIVADITAGSGSTGVGRIIVEYQK